MSDVANTTEPVDAIYHVINSITSIGEGGVAQLFTGYGENLLLALTVIAVAWVGIENVIENRPFQKLLADFISVILTWGIATWLITGVGGISLAKEINAGFDMIANTILDATAESSGSSLTLNPPAYSMGGSPEQYTQATSNFTSNVAAHALATSFITAARLFEEPNKPTQSAINKAEQEAQAAKQNAQ